MQIHNPRHDVRLPTTAPLDQNPTIPPLQMQFDKNVNHIAVDAEGLPISPYNILRQIIVLAV